MSVGHLPSADLHGTPGDVGITDYRLKIARNVKLDDRLIPDSGMRVDDAPLLKVSQDLG